MDIIEQALSDLIATVEIACNPPDKCNDPEVLKKYMKGCLEQAQTARRAGYVGPKCPNPACVNGEVAVTKQRINTPCPTCQSQEPASEFELKGMVKSAEKRADKAEDDGDRWWKISNKRGQEIKQLKAKIESLETVIEMLKGS